jgi:hypothetical protein
MKRTIPSFLRMMAVGVCLTGGILVTTALPTLLVDSGQPKCITVEAPQDTIIQVNYEAPGTYNFVYLCKSAL